MDADKTEDRPPAEVPNDATYVRQSNWAWLWSVVPWACLALVAQFADFITFIGLPLILALVLILPQFLRWRGTVYILTDTDVVYLRGAGRRYELAISEVREVQLRPGLFGNSLGYTAVYLMLRDGQAVHFPYVPMASPLVEHVQARIDAVAPHEDAAEAEG